MSCCVLVLLPSSSTVLDKPSPLCHTLIQTHTTKTQAYRHRYSRPSPLPFRARPRLVRLLAPPALHHQQHHPRCLLHLSTPHDYKHRPMPLLSSSSTSSLPFLVIITISMLLLRYTTAFAFRSGSPPTTLPSILRLRPHQRQRQTLRALVSSSSTPSSSKVGFIGLGYMGAGMVRRLLEKGDDVIVWNRSVEKSEKLLSEYPVAGRVSIATSPKQVLEEVGEGLTFSMLSTPAAAREVFHAPNGILAGIKKGSKLIDCATLEVKDMQAFDSAVKVKGGSFLEAPVSGSKVPAETGQLLFLTGGNEEVFEEAMPHLSAMGKASFFLGDTGKGTEMKLVVNMIMATMMSSLSEGLALADKANLSTEDVVKVLSLGAMANPLFNLKGPKIIKDDHTVNFPLKHAQKDLAFALALAEKVGVKVPAAAAANEGYVAALEQGEGEKDFSAVARVVMK